MKSDGGTSTFDGLSIAQAVVEYIYRHIHGKTLFATHYHELIHLEEVYPRLENYTVAVKEKGKDVAFLRRIVKGGADRSYGIHVARLAGLPADVLNRAEELLQALEAGSHRDGEDAMRTLPAQVAEPAKKVSKASRQQAAAEEAGFGSGNLFTSSVIDDLLAVDVMSITPIEALNVLYKLQESARKGGGK